MMRTNEAWHGFLTEAGGHLMNFSWPDPGTIPYASFSEHPCSVKGLAWIKGAVVASVLAPVSPTLGAFRVLADFNSHAPMIAIFKFL